MAPHDDDINQQQLVTVATFSRDVDASIALGVLRTNGIPCILSGEMVSNVLGIQLPAGSIRLLVYESDLETARSLLPTSDYE